jgi:hypothetical protein
VTFHKSFMMDAGLTSPDAEAIASCYQTVANPHDDKELLAYVKRLHAMHKTTDNDMDGLKRCGLSKGEVFEATRVAGLFSGIYR